EVRRRRRRHYRRYRSSSDGGRGLLALASIRIVHGPRANQPLGGRGRRHRGWPHRQLDQ
ncbi:hypothetical protein ACHAXT_011175, partial [Thalassiosira profunda]